MPDMRIYDGYVHTQDLAHKMLLLEVVRRAQYDAILYSLLPDERRSEAVAERLQREAIWWLRGETIAPNGKLDIRNCIAAFDSGSIPGALAQARWHWRDKNRSGEIPEGLFPDGLYVDKPHNNNA